MYQEMDDYWIIPSVYDLVLNPAECVVQRDISSVLYCLNDTKKYVNALCVVAQASMQIHPLLGVILLMRKTG